MYELDNYLKAYKLSLYKRTKADKIKIIISQFNKNGYCEVVVADDVPSSENDSDSENEFIDLNETWPSDSELINNTDIRMMMTKRNRSE